MITISYGQLALIAAILLFVVIVVRRNRRSVTDPLAPQQRASRPKPPTPTPGPVMIGTGTSQVVLQQSGSKKIAVIKIVREATGIGLKEAKELVDASDHAPQVVIAGITQHDAMRVVATLQDAGATADVR